MPFSVSPLYPILDAAWLPADQRARAEALRQVAHALAAAGVTLLQYRDKQGTDAEVLRDARLLREAAPASLRIVLNDRVHLVEATACNGAHVGQGDMEPSAARALLGPERILGLSTHMDSELLAAEASPVDYIAVGPVYATGSKADAQPVVGLEGVRRARALTTRPLVAIGGITLARAAEVRAAGADGVAVISALFPAGDGLSGKSYERLEKLCKDFLARFR